MLPQESDRDLPSDSDMERGKGREVGTRGSERLVSPGRVSFFALMAGILAGAVSWTAGELTVNHYSIPTKTETIMNVVVQRPVAGAEESTMFRNAMLSFSLLGAVLGLTMGLAGGLARGSARSAAGASILGLLLATAAAAGSSALLVAYFLKNWNPDSENLILPLLVHGGIWSAIGGGAGMAFGAGYSGIRGLLVGLIGGLVGGALGAAAYEVIGAIAFPLDRTVDPVSITRGSRFLARMAVGVLVAVCVAVAINFRAKRLYVAR
ncbi:MAG: hypothetical protein NVSMB9_28780 [Isosphaeraceae bacterium]